MPASSSGRPACGDGSVWNAQWGLRFESQTDVGALERSFWATRNAAHQATAAVLTAGVALVHGLLALKLHSQGQNGLATAAAATMGQQVVVWLLAVLAPSMFSRLRPLLYAFSITFPAVQSSSLFTSNTIVVNCGSPHSAAFWMSQLLASGVPWLVVHAVLFPLTVTQGLVVHGTATLLLLSNNSSRCAAALQQCPAAGPLLARIAAALQRLSIFSASSAGMWLGGGASGAGDHGGGEVPPAAEQLRSCMAVYSSLQIAIGYLAVLQLAWWLERAARLAFLRRTDEVEAEWRLERKQRPPGTLLLELAALLLLAWQVVDFGMVLAMR